MIVVEVLITSCQVSLKPKSGPESAHSSTAAAAVRKAPRRPVHIASLRANSENRSRPIAPRFLLCMRNLLSSWLE